MATGAGQSRSNGANSTHFQDDSPTGDSAQKSQLAQQPAHRRTYQACIPCRRRKVRCDLGEVDNPHDPPCNRCRREAKECFFSATRRKKKTEGGDKSEFDAGDAYGEIHSSRKRQRLSAPDFDDAIDDEDDVDEAPRTPGGSYGRSQPLRRPTQSKPTEYREEEVKASEVTTAILQNHEVHGGHDALKLLFVAAKQMRGRTPSIGALQRPGLQGFTPTSAPSIPSPASEQMPHAPKMMSRTDSWKGTSAPSIPKQQPVDELPPDLEIDYAAGFKAWSRFRFVRAGWLTAKEAIDYVIYFYQYLSPLTPVVLPDFRRPETHKRLLEEEPMLAVTMLLIASRHMKLPGPGSLSRPYSLHDKFYKYLDGMIKRVIWGQEQFGGGFCGAGGPAAMPGCDINPLTRKGLRTLGTVESLLLLTEWHPRAMHFPPEEDDDELMVPDEQLITPELTATNEVPKGIGGHRMDAWLEPCWRSDRMCWMLTGMAMSLAFEIGVFDSTEWQRHARSSDGQPLQQHELDLYDQRRNNVKNVLLIYTTLTSGRIGLTSMLPGNYSTPEDSELYNTRTLDGTFNTFQVTLHFWLRIAAIMREGNNSIFKNRDFTRTLIRTGEYKGALARIQPLMQQWHQQLTECKQVPQFMRFILEIEYEYARVHINAIALQAVVERCAKYPGNSPNSVVDPSLQEATSTLASNGTISPASLAKWLEGDRKNVFAVSEAARNLLKIIVDGLAPNEFLRHAPVRTYFRIISTAIVLLKTFSLGATESDVADSLTLMDRTVAALRNCVVDDVHVASRFADLLDLAMSNLKPRLLRIAADGRQGRSRRASYQHMANQSPSMDFAAARTDAPGPAQPGFLPPNGWRQSTNGAPTSGQGMNGNGINSQAMYGIPDELYDLTSTDAAFSVMPPPGYFNSPTDRTNPPADPSTLNIGNGGVTSNYNPNNSAAASAAYHTANGTSDEFVYGSQDWLALPLNSLFNMQGAEVEQSMFGPTFGSQGDMLEVMLHEQNGTFNAGNINTFG